MTNRETLRAARDALLDLHKELVDITRRNYEVENGPISNAEFLMLLLNDSNFRWLRRFSGLLIEIDEILSEKDGIAPATIARSMEKLRLIADVEAETGDFIEKFKAALASSAFAARSFTAFKARVN